MAKTPSPRPTGSKTDRAKFQPTAAERRLAAKQAVAKASAGRAAKRRRRMMAFYLPSVIVLVVILVLALVSVVHKNNKSTSNGHVATAAGSVAALVTGVSPTLLDNVGIGTAQTPPTQLTGAALTSNGKPRVLYVGAEWCPFCAAERWPLTVALSRFGTFTGLSLTKSAADDVDPNTPTLSYATAKFTSKYIVFDGEEIQDGNRKTIKTLSAADSALFQSQANGSFPYVNLGGKFLLNAAQYQPSLLAGKTQQQIATDLSNPEAKTTQAIGGAANVLTAAICKLTNSQPSNVCSASGVVAASNALR